MLQKARNQAGGGSGEEEVSFRLVDDLQSAGINQSDIKKLQGLTRDSPSSVPVRTDDLNTTCNRLLVFIFHAHLDAGFMTIGSVLQSSSRELVTIKGLTEAKIEKIKEAAKKLDCRGAAFKTGLEVKERRKLVTKITTG
jgi:DNA-directed RNA polymerase alpha subunit